MKILFVALLIYAVLVQAHSVSLKRRVRHTTKNKTSTDAPATSTDNAFSHHQPAMNLRHQPAHLEPVMDFFTIQGASGKYQRVKCQKKQKTWINNGDNTKNDVPKDIKRRLLSASDGVESSKPYILTSQVVKKNGRWMYKFKRSYCTDKKEAHAKFRETALCADVLTSEEELEKFGCNGDFGRTQRGEVEGKEYTLKIKCEEDNGKRTYKYIVFDDL